MKRRDFLKKAGVAVAASATFGTINVHAQQRRRWRMACSWPRALDTLFGGAEYFCDRVRAFTNGTLDIEPYPGGELVPALGVHDAVEQGVVECGHTAGYYYVGKDQRFAYDCAVPFGPNTQQQNAWFYHGGGIEACQRAYDDYNIVFFPAGNTGAQMGGWFRQEIGSVDDVRGLRMRIPGPGGQVFERLGGNTQVLPGGEIFLALERGAIDAAEWVGPYDDERLGLHQTARYYYYPAWHEPSTTLSVYINRREWDNLTQEQQLAIEAAAQESNMEVHARYEARNGDALQRLIDGGTQLRQFPTDVLTEAARHAVDIREEFAAANPAYRELYEQWKGFLAVVRGWTRINEYSMLNFVYENDIAAR
jgi:TRAP-type mannitol/chloroaromatic compound transport system substrate-binding protein